DAAYGTYDMTGSGPIESWADIARRVFELRHGNGDAIKGISTGEYFASASGPVAPRPVHSALDLSKLESTGFSPADWTDNLNAYMGVING
uniref:sugar nucleotide-binding protein n=1 Tax=uncultured Bifidobacterium sp. TaxID=165187 RepID=UPI00261E129B